MHPCQGQLFRGNPSRKKEERLPAEVEALDLHLHRRQGHANAPQLQTVEQPPFDLRAEIVSGVWRETASMSQRAPSVVPASQAAPNPRTDESCRQKGDQAVYCRAFHSSNPTVK